MKQKILDLIIAAKRTDPETGSFAEWLAEYLVANGVTVQEWVPVTERLPEERESIFAKMIGTPKEQPGMFAKGSGTVLVTVVYEDGSKGVTAMSTTDGKWRLGKLHRAKEVTHWMPFPEPPGKDGA